MAEPGLILAIDGGNSKTDVALVAENGTLLASLRGPGASQEKYGIDGAMRILDELVREVAEKAGVVPGYAADGDRPRESDRPRDSDHPWNGDHPRDSDCPRNGDHPRDGGPPGTGRVARHTSACLAGADLPEEESALTAALLGQGWSESAIAMNDTFAVLRAGLRPDRGEPSWGVAVTCGAGINCVAVGPDGQVARYLALGSLTGDWGGGGSLSSETVWHAVRAEDGRGPETALRPAVAEYFGFGRVTDIAVAEHKGQLSHGDLLPLTRVLFTVADAGDAVARAILARQAEEICVMTVAAMRRIGLRPDGTPLVLGGGVLAARNDLLLGMIRDRLEAAAPGVLPRVVDAPPVAGATLLGLDHLGADPAAENRLRQHFADSDTTTHQP